MNTSKQVNVMIGLLMVLFLSGLVYLLWESERASDAEERQMRVNAERGGALFSLNCRSCHGITGLGAIESGSLPGLPLNADANREANQTRIDYLRDTIRCGRIGTVMPSWSQEQGGPLNDFQILQLVTLITSAHSEEGWEHAIEEANHADEFDPPKRLAEAAGAIDTTLVLDDARGLTIGNMLRLDDEPTDENYEIVLILDTPAGSLLTESVDADQTELPVEEPALFKPGDTIVIEDETLTVTGAPARTTLAESVSVEAEMLPVGDTEGFEEGAIIRVDTEKMEVIAVSANALEVDRAVDDSEATEHAAGAFVTEEGESIEVERGREGSRAAAHNVDSAVNEVGDEVVAERGFFSTKAAEQPEGTEVFNGPILPSTSITGSGEGFPPCGQSKALIAQPTPTLAPGETPAPVTGVPISGAVDVAMGDNFFEYEGQRNPTFQVAAGETVTVDLSNNGTQIHNMRVAGEDNEYRTDDDDVSDPQAITGGSGGTIEMTVDEAGTFNYQCDFHPTEMRGQIVVQ